MLKALIKVLFIILIMGLENEGLAKKKGECPLDSRKIGQVGNKIYCLYDSVKVILYIALNKCIGTRLQPATAENIHELETLKKFARSEEGKHAYWMGGARISKDQFIWIPTQHLINDTFWNANHPTTKTGNKAVQLYPYDANTCGGLRESYAPPSDETAYILCQKII